MNESAETAQKGRKATATTAPTVAAAVQAGRPGGNDGRTISQSQEARKTEPQNQQAALGFIHGDEIWQRHVEGSCFKQVDDNWRCQLLNGWLE